MPKGNPYRSGWASQVLKDQFGVELSKVVDQNRTKWVIKRAGKEQGESQVMAAKMSHDLQSQEKFFRQTASKSTRKRLNKFIKECRQSQDQLVSQILPKLKLNEEQRFMPVYDVNFHKKFQQIPLYP